MQMVVREIGSNELSELLGLYEYLHTDDEPLPEPAIIERVWSEIRGTLQSSASESFLMKT